jgi:hypothetical protein
MARTKMKVVESTGGKAPKKGFVAKVASSFAPKEAATSAPVHKARTSVRRLVSHPASAPPRTMTPVNRRTESVAALLHSANGNEDALVALGNESAVILGVIAHIRATLMKQVAAGATAPVSLLASSVGDDPEEEEPNDSLYHLRMPVAGESQLMRCELTLRVVDERECDRCAQNIAKGVAHFTCMHTTDICAKCAKELRKTHTRRIDAKEEDFVPYDAWGRATILLTEWASYCDTSRGIQSSAHWKVEITSLVRLYFLAKSQIVIRARVCFYTTKLHKFVGASSLDDGAMMNPIYYPDLSRTWRDDGLSAKSITCSECGQGAVSAYFCADPECFHSLCFRCYALSKRPGHPVNFPLEGEYGLPPALPCAALRHGPPPKGTDNSMVLSPTIVVGIHSLTVAEVAAATTTVKEQAFSLDSADKVLNAGCGFYPFVVNALKARTQASVTQAVHEVALQLHNIEAESLFIYINAHMGAECIWIGNLSYSDQQIMGLIDELVRAFRCSKNRIHTGRVVVYFNICAVFAAHWNEVVQTQSPLTRFELVGFEAPVMFDTMTQHTNAFLRRWMNDAFRFSWGGQELNTEHVMAKIFSSSVLDLMKPFLLRHGAPPTMATDFDEADGRVRALGKQRTEAASRPDFEPRNSIRRRRESTAVLSFASTQSESAAVLSTLCAAAAVAAPVASQLDTAGASPLEQRALKRKRTMAARKAAADESPAVVETEYKGPYHSLDESVKRNRHGAGLVAAPVLKWKANLSYPSRERSRLKHRAESDARKLAAAAQQM